MLEDPGSTEGAPALLELFLQPWASPPPFLLLSSFRGDLMQLFHLPAGMSQIFMDKSL